MKATMSPFGLVMTALLGWGSDVTAAFITRKDYGKHHTTEQEDNEDPHQRQGTKLVLAELTPLSFPVPTFRNDGSSGSISFQLLITHCVQGRVFPTLQKVIPVPEAQIAKLVSTFNFRHSVPQLSEEQWGFAALVFVRSCILRKASMHIP